MQKIPGKGLLMKRIRATFFAFLGLIVFSSISGFSSARAQTDTGLDQAPATSVMQSGTDAVSLPGNKVDCGSASSDSVSSLATKLSDVSSCWSCQLYSAVYKGMHGLVEASYNEFVDASNGGLLLVVTLFSCAFVMKFMTFLTTLNGEYEMIADLRMFVFRIAVVFTMVLLVSGTSAVGSGGMVSDFIMDGPLALGTEVGRLLSTASMKVFPGITGTDGSTLTSLFGTVNENMTDQSNMFSFQAAHLQAATQALFQLHEMGAIGVVVSAWLLLMNHYTVGSAGNDLVMFGASMYLLFVFFKFMFAFGLQYIEALVRSMIIFSLLPVFAVMWVFNSTRPIAINAVRSGLSLAGVFAMSGVVYSLAFFIMYYGYKNAFQNQGLPFTGLVSVLCNINQGAVASLMSSVDGSSGTSGNTVNWMSFFYLVGSATMATACASLPFEISEQVFAFGRGGSDISDRVQADMGSASSMIRDLARRGLK